MFYKWSRLMKKESLLFLRNMVLLLVVLYFSTFDIYVASTNTTDPNFFPLAIYDQDLSRQSQEIVKRFRPPYFYVKTYINEEKEIKTLIDEGIVSAVITFPKDFAKNLNSNKTTSLQVILDGTNSNASEIALGYIHNIISEYNVGLWAARLKASGIGQEVPAVEVRPFFLGNSSLNEGWILALQELFTVITLLGLVLITTAIVNEKQFGTIEQLMVSPLKTYEIILPKVITMMGVIFSVVFIALFVVLRPLGVPLVGSIWELFIVTLLYIFTLTGYGLLIATLSKNLSETILISFLILLPILFLSGMYVPIESLSPWMQVLIGFSPLKYYLNLAYGVFLKGNSILFMWKDFCSLLTLGVVSFTIGLWRFRKAFSQ
ncbi:MAG: ABC transporter permease [Candidatus Saganbacteria bacterium]|nr:ABC transporter permease [Candidatus Saganbacteria bacterium]